MKAAVLLMAFAAALAPQVARPDCGSIPFDPWVKIFEPNQRALIAFNRTEEILVLSTDLRASKPTKVLEVIPLPSEPQVEKGDIRLFGRATSLIYKKLSSRDRRGSWGLGSMGGRGRIEPDRLPPAGVVTQEKQIGAHDIAVTRVLDPARFVEWVNDYLRKSGVDNPTIPEPLTEVVAEYLEEGFHWFVFDVVHLTEETSTKDPISYRFRTRSLYYPLRITRTESGETSIGLVVLMPRLVQHPTLKGAEVRPAHPPVLVTKQELRHLDRGLPEFMKHWSRPQLQIWDIKGELSSFQEDILTQ